MPKFKVLGQEYIIEVEDIERTAFSLMPNEINKYTHVVELLGKKFPIIQLISATVEIPEDMLIPLDAYKILGKLGYSIEFHKRSALNSQQTSDIL